MDAGQPELPDGMTAEEAAKTALKRKLLGEEGEAAKKLGDLLKLGD